VNDERIIQAIRIPKAEYFLRAEGVLLDQLISEVGSDYRFRCVISGHQFFGKPSPPGTAMVQSDKPLPEDFIKYWLDRLRPLLATVARTLNNLRISGSKKPNQVAAWEIHPVSAITADRSVFRREVLGYHR
jgi:hypothetical protein